MKDYYNILGVDETATQDDIKKSYRKLSKQYHPDVNPDGEEMFKEISEAYENIGDEVKRSDYDNRRKNPFAGMGGGGFDFQDIFDQMMGGRTPRQKKAPDKVVSVNMDPIESYFGVKKELNVNTFNKCAPCDGTGGSKKICDTCKGQGVVIQIFGTGMFQQRVQSDCPVCNGSGSKILNACGSCGGHGVKPENEKIIVTIPANVDNGDFLRLVQKGDYNTKIKIKGDLILKVNLLNNEKFEKIGIDLIYNLKVSPICLAIEDDLIIEHPDGNVSIKIPENISTSKPLRVMSKGYKTPQGIGNFYIKLTVEKTENINNQIKDQIKNLLKQTQN